MVGGMGMMKRIGWLAGVAAAALMAGCQGEAGQGATAGTVCADMLKLEAPDVRITGATVEATPVAHCKVSGVIGKEINFVVWLPEDWNGRLLMSGNGGLAGFIPPIPPGTLDRGYAVAGTDTGHVSPSGMDSSWSVGEMERQLNFAHLAIHRAAATSKFVAKAHYGRATEKSLFFGCSDGGRQGLMEAQRYPEDFDGVIAGSSVINLAQHGLNQITISRLNFPSGKPENGVIGPKDLDLLHGAVMAKCDGADGLKDGVINDPPACDFDPKELSCKPGQADGCLSKDKLAVAEAIYGGTKLDGKPFAPGYSIGGETVKLSGWGWFVGGDPEMAKLMPPGAPPPAYAITSGPFIGGEQMSFYDKDAQGRWKTDVETYHRKPNLMTSTMSPTSPDLDAFRKNGGKLLVYHGWSDTSLPPRMTLNYVEEVYARDPEARDDVRLFMEPGMLHCQSQGGGPMNAPMLIDYVSVLDRWVSGGAAPDEIEAKMPDGNGVRKVCAWPTRLTFKGGDGDGKTPDQFECR